MNKYELSGDVLKVVLEYLAKRPYMEVFNLIHVLQRLPEIKEVPKVETKKEMKK